MINRLDDTFVYILTELKSILGPIIIIVLVLTIIQILINYIKYGGKIFDVFKKRKSINITYDSLEIIIKNLKVYYKLIKINNGQVILLLESGIYVLYILDYNGIITGDIKKDTLVLKANTENQQKIANPVYVINNQIKKLEKIVNENIKGYVLLKKGCLFSVLNRTDIKVIPANAFYYHFSKFIKNKKLSKKQIDEIYEKIVA
ncbi:MAG: hypothetical protein E7169_00955 [Firmicutes bacterium]|nr:hypothetical protein [Bacillota bacterium]